VKPVLATAHTPPCNSFKLVPFNLHAGIFIMRDCDTQNTGTWNGAQNGSTKVKFSA